MFVRRQITAMLARGNASSIEVATSFPFRMRDVKPSTVLVVGDGKRCGQVLSLDPSDSYTVQLPIDYDSSNRLHGSLVTNGTIKAVVTSPELTGTSTQLITGRSTARGTWVFQQRITSIVISNPTSSVVLVEYDLFELPSDLADPASYRDGSRTIGTI